MAVLSVSFQSPYTALTDFYRIYFFSGIWGALGLGVFASIKYKEVSAQGAPAGKKWMALIVLALSFIATRYYFFPYNLVWQDDYNQFLGSFKPLDQAKSIFDFATSQQQPPLDYYLSHFAYLVLGDSLVALKFHTLLFSGSYILILFLWLYTLTKDFCISCVVSLYALSIPLFIFYSLEARPISLTLFTSVFVLAFSLRVILENRKKDKFFLMASGFIFVTTTGFQPEVFLMTLFLSVTPFLYLKNIRKNVTHLFFCYSIVGVYFLPYFYAIYEKGMTQKQFNVSAEVNSQYKIIPYAIGEFYISNYESNNRLLILILFAISALWSAIKYREQKKKIATYWFFTFIVLFPIVFNLLYENFVNWDHNYYYHIVYISVYLSLFAICLNLVTKINPQRLISVGAILICLIMTTTNLIGTKEFLEGESSYRIDWQGVYQHLNNRLTPEDRVVQISFTKLGDYPRPAFIAYNIFLKKEFTSLIAGNSKYYYQHLEVGPVLKNFSGRLFVLMDADGREVPQMQELKNELKMSLTEFQNIFIFEIQADDRQRFIEVLENFVANHPQDPYLYKVYETLIAYHQACKDIQSVKERIDNYGFVDPKNDYTDRDGSIVNPTLLIENRKKVMADFFKEYDLN